MDKQVMAVLLSFVLYVFYVLLPMIPAVVIYRMFPDTKVSTSGILSQLSFKTTGAFAAYVVTTVLGFFLVSETHQLIAQISNPVWTLRANVDIADKNDQLISNKTIVETLEVTIEPKLLNITGDQVILSLPGTQKSWETTKLKFSIPKWGSTIMYVSDIAEHAKIDKYALFMKSEVPVRIKADEQIIKPYEPAEGQLVQDNKEGSSLNGLGAH